MVLLCPAHSYEWPPFHVIPFSPVERVFDEGEAYFQLVPALDVFRPLGFNLGARWTESFRM